MVELHILTAYCAIGQIARYTCFQAANTRPCVIWLQNGIILLQELLPKSSVKVPIVGIWHMQNPYCNYWEHIKNGRARPYFLPIRMHASFLTHAIRVILEGIVFLSFFDVYFLRRFSFIFWVSKVVNIDSLQT